MNDRGTSPDSLGQIRVIPVIRRKKCDWHPTWKVGYTFLNTAPMIQQATSACMTRRGSKRMASNLSKNLVFGSFAAAGGVALLSLLDLVLKVPFAGSVTMDILFILSAAIVGYLGWDAYKDLA